MWFHQLLLSALFWVVLKEGKVYLHKIKVVYYVSTLVRIHNTLQKKWSKCDNSNVICNLPLTYVVLLTITDTFSHWHFSARGNEKLKKKNWKKKKFGNIINDCHENLFYMNLNCFWRRSLKLSLISFRNSCTSNP